jgi:hypothetical protein
MFPFRIYAGRRTSKSLQVNLGKLLPRTTEVVFPREEFLRTRVELSRTRIYPMRLIISKNEGFKCLSPNCFAIFWKGGIKISKLEGLVNVKNKFCSIIEKNVGFQKLNEISEVINGNFSTELDLEPHFISKFKFAPITSCDVERVFSTNIF